MSSSSSAPRVSATDAFTLAAPSLRSGWGLSCRLHRRGGWPPWPAPARPSAAFFLLKRGTNPIRTTRRSSGGPHARTKIEVALAPNAFRHVRRTKTRRLLQTRHRVSYAPLRRPLSRAPCRGVRLRTPPPSPFVTTYLCICVRTPSRVLCSYCVCRAGFVQGLERGDSRGLAVVVRAWRDHRRLSSFSREALNPTELQCGDHTRGRKVQVL